MSSIVLSPAPTPAVDLNDTPTTDIGFHRLSQLPTGILVTWRLAWAVVGGKVVVGRRVARAILIDAEDRLVLIKRTKSNQRPYWTTPGGGVEESDESVEAALRRELGEELGAKVSAVSQVLRVSTPSETGVAIQHFFVARLLGLNGTARTGPEFQDPSQGQYELDRVDLWTDDLASMDLKPLRLREYIMENRRALLAELAMPR